VRQTETLLHALEFNLQHIIGEIVITSLSDERDRTHCFWRKHHFVVDQRILGHNTKNVTTSQMVTDFEGRVGDEFPWFV
jgi:hypothetical protein